MAAHSKPKETAVEVVGPLDTAQLIQAVRWAGAMTGLSRWERHKLEWEVKRQRVDLIRQLIEVEHGTVVAEAIVAAGGRLSAARERAAAAAFLARLDCLLEMGERRDQALAATNQLSEDSREIVAGAIDRISGTYIAAMESRAHCD